MPEQLNNRIRFKIKGVQRKYVLAAKKSLGLTGLVLSGKLGISQRTLTDWMNESVSISVGGARALARLTGKPIPKNHSIIDWRMHLKNIGKTGGMQKLKIHGSVGGNEEYRKRKWEEWWLTVGKHKKLPKNFRSLLAIKIPKKNAPLAEFVGIMLGDGGIAPYHIHITLSNKEREYIKYIISVIKRLFGIMPKVHILKYAEAIDIVVQRKNLVDFCQSIGLVLGNKVRQQVDIPQWIKENPSYWNACIRGLVDTDGCFYINSYQVGGKTYSYFKIAFTSASIPLIQSVFKILNTLGIKARISKNKKDVRIEGGEYVSKYIREIGSHNDKHLQKIKKWKKSKNMLE